jgi:hypothetical protein
MQRIDAILDLALTIEPIQKEGAKVPDFDLWLKGEARAAIGGQMNLRPPLNRADTYQQVFSVDRDTALRMETAALQTGTEFVLEDHVPKMVFFEPSFVGIPAFRV